jgi:hypothetical protein
MLTTYRQEQFWNLVQVQPRVFPLLPDGPSRWRGDWALGTWYYLFPHPGLARTPRSVSKPFHSRPETTVVRSLPPKMKRILLPAEMRIKNEPPVLCLTRVTNREHGYILIAGFPQPMLVKSPPEISNSP